MALRDLRIYQEASSIADETSSIVSEWSHFDQHVLGKQLCRAVDSIASNISEGYGRASTGERLQFMFYADGSLQEAKNQYRLAFGRNLIDEELNKHYQSRLRKLSIAIIEFCAAILDRDSEYSGQYRDRVNRRRAWLLRYYESNKNKKKNSDTSPEVAPSGVASPEVAPSGVASPEVASPEVAPSGVAPTGVAPSRAAKLRDTAYSSSQ
jgi:four helix bundle protein